MLKGSIESQTPSERNSLEAALKRVEEQQPSSQKSNSKKSKQVAVNSLSIVLQESKQNVEAAMNTTLATSEKQTACEGKSNKAAGVKLGKRKSSAKENN